ncbi:MAG: pyridoxamine 5'-phosphate oxidase [Verrucomicrobiota bacterium]|nr:pyridoxamine 5'-phosphate oxidase [Verrucomicrobiota bacterium]
MSRSKESNRFGLNAVFGDEAEPLPLFHKWYAEAEQAESYDHTAFALATADASGRPSVRMLLLKGASEVGFTFYTNLNSRKATELRANPHASICFHWKNLRRQIRISGPVTPVSDAEADSYFASRDHGSRVGAWASQQSSTMTSLAEFKERLAELQAKYPEGSEVPRPPHWSGWRLGPSEIEFWLHGEDRLHERLLYRKTGDDWERSILHP